MAEKVTIKVLSREVKELPTKEGKTYKKLFIVGEDQKEYNKIYKEGDYIPSIGNELELFVQTVKLEGKQINSILNLKQLGSTTNNNIEVNTQMNTKKSTQTSNTDDKFFKIKGTIFYAHVREPNTKGNYPSNKYQLDLAISDKTVEALEARGIQIKNKGDEKGNFVTLKANKQPKVVGTDGTLLDPVPLIGNGTTATVSVNIYPNRETNAKAGKGGKNCLGFYQVEIEKLVPFGTEAKLLVGDDE